MWSVMGEEYGVCMVKRLEGVECDEWGVWSVHGEEVRGCGV